MPRRKAIAAVIALSLGLSLTGMSAGAQAEEEITIIRDKFGVPHVYAPTSAGVSYGAGYALAQDRLWQMHVLRRLAKGRLSEILGPIVVELDKEARFWTYTAEERAARFQTYPKDIRDDLQAFADGINAWMAEARANPPLVPQEFIKYGEQDALLEDWTVDDSVALGDTLILSFGSGGGNELLYANLLDALVQKFGKSKGMKAFDDLILTSDPDTPISIPRGYKFGRKKTFARTAESQERRGLQGDARLSLPQEGRRSTARTVAARKGTFEQLSLIPDMKTALRGFAEHQDGLAFFRKIGAAIRFGSNAQLAGPRFSRVDNSLQTGGPQVGYYIPQILTF